MAAELKVTGLVDNTKIRIEDRYAEARRCCPSIILETIMEGTSELHPTISDGEHHVKPFGKYLYNHRRQCLSVPSNVDLLI